MYPFTRRGAIRIFSYAAAALCVLLSFTVHTWRERNLYRHQLETLYQRALQDAADLVGGISLSLEKQLHAAGEQHEAILCALLLKQAGEAKAALSSLPAGQDELYGAYRFLSQVGDYALRAAREEQTPGSYQDTLVSLLEYAQALQTQLCEIQSRAAFGQLSLADAVSSASGPDSPSSPDTAPQAGVSESGFAQIEESFSGYPTLIYDGPFSDHLLERSPRLTEGRPTISREVARKAAAACAFCSPELLEDGEDERSRLPLYTFKTGETVIGITRDGGFPCYMVDGRAIAPEASVSEEQARESALRYLAYLGLSSLKETYYETACNILTINFAYYQQGVICYPDLIKVGVALDSGRVVFFDARGYIMNHHERTLPAATYGEQQARESVSPLLQVRSSRLALIPTAGGREAFCYEIAAVGLSGEEYLAYIDAQTGEEQELLKLIHTGSGVLTQ